MSLRPNTLITITQVPNDIYPDRSSVFTIDFVNSGNINKSWQNLTDTAKMKLPRSVYVEDKFGNLTNWTDKSIYGTTGSESPLFMRGDIITIELGVFVDNMDGTETLEMPAKPQFEGYITKIKNRLPIELECEDEMWKLKQINAPNKLFKGSQYSVKQIIAELLQGTKYTVNDMGFTVNIGDFRTQNETVAQVLERIRKDGGLYSYFRGTELRVSGVVYNPTDMETQEVFEFQENIISDQLEYTRKEDLNIAVKAYAQAIGQATGFNEDGSHKTTHTRLEVTVGKINPAGDLGEINGKTFHGDLITFPVLGATTKAQLLDRAKKYLPKFYYTGFRGSFTTHVIPVVDHGNQAIIRDRVIPERSGTYLIKQVSIDFGMGSHKQKVMLHLRTDVGFTIAQLNAGVAG